MNEKELVERLTEINEQLEHLREAVITLLEESVHKEKIGIFKDMDEDIDKFFGVMK